MVELQPKLFRRALEIVGNDEATLCRKLCAEPHALKMWMRGQANAPAWVLQAVIDLIVQDGLARAAQDRRRQPRPQNGPLVAQPAEAPDAAGGSKPTT